jgi:hypothetical protein
MGSKDDNLQTSTPDRLKSMMAAKSTAERLKAEGTSISEHGQRQSVSTDSARKVIQEWPQAPKMTAETILDHYGQPNEATPTKLFWYNTGPWSRMEITADQAVHNFPTPHTDFFTQYVAYPVPSTKASDLIAFDGSVIIDRTTGEIGARCDAEAYNTLTLNLAVEIIEGRRSVDGARKLYAETAAAYVMGRPAPYAEGLMFTPPAEGTADPDQAILAPEMAQQMVEKVKDTFGVLATHPGKYPGSTPCPIQSRSNDAREAMDREHPSDAD